MAILSEDFYISTRQKFLCAACIYCARDQNKYSKLKQ